MKTIYCVLSIGLIYFGISVFKSASVDRFDFYIIGGMIILFGISCAMHVVKLIRKK